MSLVTLIEDEPVRLVGAVQATLALIVLVLAWVGDIQIPAEVTAAVVVAIAAWLSFVTRENVTPA